jgi:hypothetical protein
MLIVQFFVSASVHADWLKMNPPPDVDKYDYGHDSNSCWIACAANMLSGAGYGDGSDPNERAHDIYKEMCNHFDPNKTGWADTALDWWLDSANNKWDTNPYKHIRFHGHRDPRPPWARTDLPMLIGNKLRDCEFVRLSIRKPTCDSSVGIYGHAITAWGDNGSSDVNELTSNPGKVWVTDSDKGNMLVWEQQYTYDDYNSPNPGDSDDCNEGPGWYINYKAGSHWYIDGIITLSTTDGNSPKRVQTIVASTSATYNGTDPCATDLHYKIYTDANDILSYTTRIDWQTNQKPTCTETDANLISVEWNLEYDPVPKGTTVKITAEIVIPNDPCDPNVASGGLKGIYWTPMNLQAIPGSLFWGRRCGLGSSQTYNAPNMCGGYVICSFWVYKEYPVDIYTPLGEYRFQYEYKYWQNPEVHDFQFLPEQGLPPPEPPGARYVMGEFRFGHSYALLLDDELWAYNGPWRTYELTTPPYPELQSWTFLLRWPGQLLPYPQGQYYPKPKYCGDTGTDYLTWDLDTDCLVNFDDLAIMALDWVKDYNDLGGFASEWLDCTDPCNPYCDW